MLEALRTRILVGINNIFQYNLVNASDLHDSFSRIWKIFSSMDSWLHLTAPFIGTTIVALLWRNKF